MNYTLRPPQPIDYELIAAWVTDATACLRWAGPRLVFPFSATDLPALLDIDGIESHCLANGSAVACGFGQHWVLTPGSVHLGRIIVSPAMRGKGLGRLLCEQLIEKALRHTGASEITLRVYRDNKVAAALYASLGFAAVEGKSSEEVFFMKRVIEEKRETARSM